MKFEEWKAKHYPNINLGGYSISKKAWDAAIDEAAKIADKHDCMGRLSKKIKKLKG